MEDANDIKPIVVKMSSGKRILIVVILLLLTAFLTIAAFAMDEWLLKLFLILFTLIVIFIGFGMLRGVCPPSLIINSDGIRESNSLFLWDDIVYTSKTSLFYEECATKLNSLSEEEIMEMDGQDYEELEVWAAQKDIENIYVGIMNHKDRAVNELCIGNFFKKEEFDDIVQRLNKMRKYYSNSGN